MSGSIPTRTTVQTPPAGRKQRRFIATPNSVAGVVLSGPVQQRANTNDLPQMRSVQSVTAGTGALDAQRRVYETMKPGAHVEV